MCVTNIHCVWAQPLKVTTPCVSTAENMADLIDGYCRLVNKSSSSFIVRVQKGTNHSTDSISQLADKWFAGVYKYGVCARPRLHPALNLFFFSCALQREKEHCLPSQRLRSKYLLTSAHWPTFQRSFWCLWMSLLGFYPCMCSTVQKS